MGDKSWNHEIDPTSREVKEQMLREARALDKGIRTLGATDNRWVTNPDYPKDSASMFLEVGGSATRVSADPRQSSLFSGSSTSFDAKPAAKTQYRDPEVLYCAIFENVGLTSHELVPKIRELVRKDSGSDKPPFRLNGLYRRLPELERMGLIRRSGQKICSITGRFATTWDITGSEGNPTPAPSIHRAHSIMAVGLNPLQAVETFAAAIGWTVLSTEQLKPKKHLKWRLRVRTSDGQSFEAGGLKVPGGVVLTRWR